MSVGQEDQRKLWDVLHIGRGIDYVSIVDHPNMFAELCVNWIPVGGKVIDLGSSIGRDVRYFVKTKGCTAVALDFSSEALDQLVKVTPPKMMKRIKTVQTDMLKYWFQDGPFDVIYARSALHLTDEQLSTLLQRGFGELNKRGFLMIEGRTPKDSKLAGGEEIMPNLYKDADGHIRRGWTLEYIEKIVKQFDLTLIDVRETTKPQEERVLSYISFIAQK